MVERSQIEQLRLQANDLTERRKKGRSNVEGRVSTQHMNKVRHCMENQYGRDYVSFIKLYGSEEEFWKMVEKEMDWYAFEHPANQCEFLIIKYRPILIALEK